MSKTVAIIGGGQRGTTYANLLQKHDTTMVTAVVERKEDTRKWYQKTFHLSEDMVFDNYNDFFAKGKICDAVVIATLDDEHFEPTKKAIELGYQILLEKPITIDLEETKTIQKLANEYNTDIMVCHVLRYTPFYQKIKNILDCGIIGSIVTIQHMENIGNFHMAHSFVRGNWRNSNSAAPIIMQKSCHDMDILSWLVGEKCKNVSSFGSLTYFKKENQPEGAVSYCYDCQYQENCIYSAEKVYLPRIGFWPTTVLTLDQTVDGVKNALRTSNYGRCVFDSDNNVCDHQVTILEFENGITATFHLTAFTNEIAREIKIMGTKGCLTAHDGRNEIEITTFNSGNGQEKKTIKINPTTQEGGHGGGDTGIIEDFIKLLNNEIETGLTNINASIESHLMAHAAEQSRLEGRKVTL